MSRMLGPRTSRSGLARGGTTTGANLTMSSRSPVPGRELDPAQRAGRRDDVVEREGRRVDGLAEEDPNARNGHAPGHDRTADDPRIRVEDAAEHDLLELRLHAGVLRHLGVQHQLGEDVQLIGVLDPASRVAPHALGVLIALARVARQPPGAGEVERVRGVRLPAVVEVLDVPGHRVGHVGAQPGPADGVEHGEQRDPARGDSLRHLEHRVAPEAVADDDQLEPGVQGVQLLDRLAHVLDEALVGEGIGKAAGRERARVSPLIDLVPVRLVDLDDPRAGVVVQAAKPGAHAAGDAAPAIPVHEEGDGFCLGGHAGVVGLADRWPDSKHREEREGAGSHAQPSGGVCRPHHSAPRFNGHEYPLLGSRAYERFRYRSNRGISETLAARLAGPLRCANSPASRDLPHVDADEARRRLGRLSVEQRALVLAALRAFSPPCP